MNGLNQKNFKMILSSIILVIPFILHTTFAKPPPSPCPSIFAYEGDFEDDRWYGVISFTSNIELAGLNIKVQMDRPSNLLVSWAGEIRSVDNTFYYIFDPYSIQRAGEIMKARIMVKFNPRVGAPIIRTIIINGNTVCAGGTSTISRPSVEDQIRETSTTERFDPVLSGGEEEFGNKDTVVNFGENNNENNNYYPSSPNRGSSGSSGSDFNRVPDYQDNSYYNNPPPASPNRGSSNNRPQYQENSLAAELNERDQLINSGSSSSDISQPWPSSRPTQNRPQEARPIQSRPQESTIIESRPQVNHRPTETRPQDIPVIESRPQSNRPTETRPQDIESRPQSNRPTETRPQDISVVESRPQTNRPTESRPPVSRPSESRPQANRPQSSRPQPTVDSSVSNLDTQTWEGNTNTRPQSSHGNSNFESSVSSQSNRNPNPSSGSQNLGSSSNFESSLPNQPNRNPTTNSEGSVQPSVVQQSGVSVATLNLPVQGNKSLEQFVESIRNQLPPGQIILVVNSVPAATESTPTPTQESNLNDTATNLTVNSTTTTTTIKSTTILRNLQSTTTTTTAPPVRTRSSTVSVRTSK